ncbi:aspartyl-phosphate phosphatase Spo0E family protein [Paludifilum halophilum]|uniref:aspartyl-phosphate phosphatase Spo0E family protein n=1 Tax=Paludifilum halophilum TaxID=1642702 RepID=UPI00146DD9CA|nr:aspartyl-phosphate phosphatase Spo0E family protein [Paludifilum halophilum]
MSSTRIKRLEQEVEHLRTALYQAVAGSETRLSHSAVLPISQKLDDLINQYYEEEKKKRES